MKKTMLVALVSAFIALSLVSARRGRRIRASKMAFEPPSITISRGTPPATLPISAWPFYPALTSRAIARASSRRGRSRSTAPCSRESRRPIEDKRVRTIDLIDVSGDSAMAKATLDHGATVFTDYFVVLKVNDEWKIANKVYHGRKK